MSKKHKLRDERLQNLGDEVRERECKALLNKNFLTIADTARLLQMSRNTLYKINKENDIPLKRFSLRTVRIAREDLDKVAAKRAEEFNVSNLIQGPGKGLGKWMKGELFSFFLLGHSLGDSIGIKKVVRESSEL